MLLIYTPKITARHRYIFKLIFRDILSIDIRITVDAGELKSYDGPKINYSQNPAGTDEIFFYSANLLSETGISKQNITVIDWKDGKAIYPIPHTSDVQDNSALPFDPFAASFYLVSRYEEYPHHSSYRHKRFCPEESLAYKNGFLSKPVINIWVREIAEIIKSKYPEFAFPARSYQYISTIDIDNAYAFLEKGIMRTIGGFARSVLYLDLYEAIDRIRVLSGQKKDPFDTYELLFQIQQKYNLKPIYFFLLGDYGYKDKNVPYKSKKLQSLINSINEYAEAGIHFSYGSGKNSAKFKNEVNRLSGILNKDITKSRQHFLQLYFPDTYRNLIDVGITDDYTMGYGSHIGFRAGICTQFYFYDLGLEQETNLKIHPFAVMDRTLKDHIKLAPDRVVAQIKQIIDDVKKVDGTFISLWHNQSLSGYREWVGWREVYEQMVSVSC
ncbi:MAG: polysaccharide deacetylase family protein [Bacteroidota bacterium]